MKTILRLAIAVFWIFLISTTNCIYGNEIFKSLTIDNGLAHTDANCIAQDSTGLMWIGTNAGLQSYDGYTLQTFDYYQEGYKIYQSHNRINGVVSSVDKLWVGTESGLTCFDLNTHRYIPYYIKREDKSYQPDVFVSGLCFNPSNRHLWIRSDYGLSVAEVNSDSLYFLEWENEQTWNLCKYINNLQIRGEYVWSLVGSQIICLGIGNGKICALDSYKTSDLLGKEERIQAIYSTDRYLYMRSARGCYRIPFEGDKLKRGESSYIGFHAVNPNIPEYTSGKFVVHQDSILWCAYLGGIIEIQQAFLENPIGRNHLENAKGGDLSKQKITDLLIDKYDNLWITMKSWGVIYRTLSNYSFKNISRQDFQKMGFSRNEVNSVVSQQGDILWMLVESGSLFRYDIQTETLSLMPVSGVNMESRFLQTIHLGKEQRYLYIGTNQGTLIYDTQTGVTRELILLPSPDSYRLNTSIAKITEDSQGRLWFGTWGDGLFCVENVLTDPKLVFHFNMQTELPILSHLVADVLVYGNSIFVCTTNGLNKIILSSSGEVKTISSYQANSALNTSMSTNYLASMDCQNDSVCWIGTIGGGLNKVVIHSDNSNDYTAVCYTSQNGLTSNDCEIVFVDDTHNVWIGGNGITRLNTDNERIYTYGSTNGLQNNAFKMGAGYKGADGTLYMGGLYGLSYFNPSETLQSVNRSELVFTNLIVNHKEIIPQNTYNDHVVLKTILDKTSELSLMYKQNNFAISFAALGYELSEQIMYRYRMKGFQESWQILRYTANQVFYSNLPYGTYEFEVQLSNDKGYTWHTPGRHLSITVLPPWWLTIWAKSAYVLLAIIILLLAMYQYNKEQNLKRENEIQKIIMAKDEEKYQAKMQFFMNASHELKTPLTLILLSAEQLLNQSLFAKECKSIFSNAKKMMSLITELVDIRKVDLGINTLGLGDVNISRLTQQLFDEISPWAENKNITISYQSADKEIRLDADKDKIGKLIINLFSNAIKYTSEGGNIGISLKEGCLKDVTPCYPTMHVEGQMDAGQLACILTVRDTGVGISQESIRLIYERFFQVKEESMSHLGSGIGLAIAKGVVLQHKGVIIVSSERMVGTEFIVALPIYHEHASADEVVDEVFSARDFIDDQYNEFLPQQQLVAKEQEAIVIRPDKTLDLPTLLIVEDNKELQIALEEHLSVNYNVLIADNGRIGLEMCETLYPDIIISDVMMPEMDGIEMCRRIKNNLSIAYIPIVMLTAKANVESQIEGYESGADLYLPKPFSIKLLEVNLRRLLTQREQWFKGYKKAVPSNEEKQPSAAIQEFERRFKEIIEENIGNSEFSADSLSVALGMSRTKLYGKMKEICDQPLSDYIRNLRLERAAHLLTHSDLNVTEVMSETGFVNSSHFSKIFKLKYGVAPSEYKKGN
jgi:signal transduction histidine kinase/DNA-binding response OmpR family regulator/ligand-binding sensor domain-containing protein